MEGLEATEKLQRDHSMDIDALKEEMAKVKTAGEDRKKANCVFTFNLKKNGDFIGKTYLFLTASLSSGAESMKKMEMRFSKTLLAMSKKFLSLEEEIGNISCEGTLSIYSFSQSAA